MRHHPQLPRRFAVNIACKMSPFSNFVPRWLWAWHHGTGLCFAVPSNVLFESRIRISPRVPTKTSGWIIIVVAMCPKGQRAASSSRIGAGCTSAWLLGSRSIRGRNGHPDCVDRRRRPFKGSCCECKVELLSRKMKPNGVTLFQGLERSMVCGQTTRWPCRPMSRGTLVHAMVMWSRRLLRQSTTYETNCALICTAIP